MAQFQVIAISSSASQYPNYVRFVSLYNSIMPSQICYCWLSEVKHIQSLVIAILHSVVYLENCHYHNRVSVLNSYKQ